MDPHPRTSFTASSAQLRLPAEHGLSASRRATGCSSVQVALHCAVLSGGAIVRSRGSKTRTRAHRKCLDIATCEFGYRDCALELTSAATA